MDSEDYKYYSKLGFFLPNSNYLANVNSVANNQVRGVTTIDKVTVETAQAMVDLEDRKYFGMASTAAIPARVATPTAAHNFTHQQNFFHVVGELSDFTPMVDWPSTDGYTTAPASPESTDDEHDNGYAMLEGMRAFWAELKADDTLRPIEVDNVFPLVEAFALKEGLTVKYHIQPAATVNGQVAWTQGLSIGDYSCYATARTKQCAKNQAALMLAKELNLIPKITRFHKFSDMCEQHGFIKPSLTDFFEELTPGQLKVLISFSLTE